MSARRYIKPSQTSTSCAGLGLDEGGGRGGGQKDGKGCGRRAGSGCEAQQREQQESTNFFLIASQINEAGKSYDSLGKIPTRPERRS